MNTRSESHRGQGCRPALRRCERLNWGSRSSVCVASWMTFSLMVFPMACSDTESSKPATTPPPAAERETSPPAPPPASATPAPSASSEAPAADTADFAGGDATAGKEVYGLYCATCHGPSGTGDGPGAAALDPKPRDFTEGAFKYDPNNNGETGEPNDLALIVRDGAAKYGGSANMTPWGAALSDQQLKDVVAYVQSLSKGDS